MIHSGRAVTKHIAAWSTVPARGLERHTAVLASESVLKYIPNTKPVVPKTYYLRTLSEGV